MSAFSSMPVAFANAKKAEKAGKLTEWLGGAVSAGIFESAEKAGELFEAACLAERASQLAETRAAAFKLGEETLAGFSWPKSVLGILGKLEESVRVLDSDGNSPPWNVSLSVDKDLCLVAKLVTGVTRTASAGRTTRSGAKLNGKPVSKATILADYPGSLAARVLNNNGKPFGLVKRKNGSDYGENTRWAALECCKNDPKLKPLLTYDK